MFVAKDYRKSGLGKQLVDTLGDFVKKKELKKSTLAPLSVLYQHSNMALKKFLKALFQMISHF
ncbi:GNAT family N-acetyltransferase [Streptococcus henryi]|uniref:GNAT family N-acetyltransferase n=1 Tax=Streptococcus henryi TaxID=439219 RepID=UPI00200A1B76|nr:GNAT family N-acetyltransferase [Streptococcus henryi]